MKRSEMLQIIYKLLHCGPDYPTEDELLTAIEEAGMQPPYDAKQDDEVDIMEWEPE